MSKVSFVLNNRLSATQASIFSGLERIGQNILLFDKLLLLKAGWMRDRHTDRPTFSHLSSPRLSFLNEKAKRDRKQHAARNTAVHLRALVGANAATPLGSTRRQRARFLIPALIAADGSIACSGARCRGARKDNDLRVHCSRRQGIALACQIHPLSSSPLIPPVGEPGSP